MPIRCLALPMLVVAFALAGCADPGVRDAQVGSIVRPGNTQVPLPPGDWKQLASVEASTGALSTGGPSNMHSVQADYAKVENGRITQLLLISTSAGAPSDYGYTTGGDCISMADDGYVYLRDVRGSTSNSIDCMRVTGNRVFRPPTARSTPLYRDAYAAAKAFGRIPLRAVWVNIAEAHSGRYLVYSMFFFPERTGQPASVSQAPAETMPAAGKAYIDGIIGWARQFRPAVRAGTMHLL